jgi:membrane-associated phospholipid phosphatase
MTKKKRLLEIILFVVIFGGLLVIASLFDLQISMLLTKGSLVSGAYYSSNIVANLIEILGTSNIFIFMYLAFMIIATYFKDKGKRFLNILFYILSGIVIIYYFHDVLKYILRIKDLEIYLVGIMFFNKMMPHTNDKWMKWAYVIICTCALYLVIELIKSPIGRMRYRAMNYIGDFSYYTPWYQISHAKSLGLDLISDSFKSFPSGHTFSTGVIYVLFALPSLFDNLNTKKNRAIIYGTSIFIVGLVAIFRIIAGAHFLSDVLIGGTLAYVGARFFTYLFIERKRG